MKKLSALLLTLLYGSAALASGHQLQALGEIFEWILMVFGGYMLFTLTLVVINYYTRFALLNIISWICLVALIIAAVYVSIFFPSPVLVLVVIGIPAFCVYLMLKRGNSRPIILQHSTHYFWKMLALYIAFTVADFFMNSYLFNHQGIQAGELVNVLMQAYYFVLIGFVYKILLNDRAIKKINVLHGIGYALILNVAGSIFIMLFSYLLSQMLKSPSVTRSFYFTPLLLISLLYVAASGAIAFLLASKRKIYTPDTDGEITNLETTEEEK